MLQLYKTVTGQWEKVRGSLREDLVQIEIVINHLWAKTFGVDLKLKNEVIDGDGGVIKTGPDGNVVSGDVDLDDLEDISAGVLLGRRSGSAGSVEELSPTAPIAVSGTNVIHSTSGVTPGTYGAADAIPILTVDNKGHVTAASEASINTIVYVPMTTGWQPPEDMDEHVQIMDNGGGEVLVVAWTPNEP
jgi:hypothetical protein